ncbi:MAG: DUF4234 domain-containing protein [Clostridia bacterium]|nr:DUF4234 domain-containing protein [Clostridia bacterium]
MAFCQKCGAPLDANATFCTNCGTPAGAGASQGQQTYQQPNYQQPNYQQNYGGVKPVSFGQRNIAIAIILSIVTFGIYGIFWFISMVNNVNEAADQPNATSGGVVFLLSIVTCSIYLWYWLYKSGQMLNDAKARRGLSTDSSAGIIYLVLALFGLSIVSWALIQNELNKIAEYHGAPAA